MRLVQVGDVTWIYPVAQLTLLADGRVITPPTAEAVTWQERRLAPGGVDAIVDLVQATGLFESNADFPMVRAPNAPEPPGMGASEIKVTFGHGGEQVLVSGVAWFGDEYEATYNLPSPARKALSGLAAQLSDLAWLPADAWLNAQPVPYVPDGYLLITEWRVSAGPVSAPSVDDVAWPFPAALGDFGQVLQQTSDAMLRCGPVDAGQGGAIVEALNRLTGTDTPPGEYYAQLQAPPMTVDLWLEPQLPDGFPGCGGLMVGGV